MITIVYMNALCAGELRKVVVLDHEGFEYEVDVDVFTEVFKDLTLLEIITMYGKLRGPSKSRVGDDFRHAKVDTMMGALHEAADKMDDADARMDFGKAAKWVTKEKRKAKVQHQQDSSILAYSMPYKQSV